MIHEKKGIYTHYEDELNKLNVRISHSISGMVELSSPDALTDLIYALEREVFIIYNNIDMVRIVGMSKETVEIEEVHLCITHKLPILKLPIHIKLLIIKHLDK